MFMMCVIFNLFRTWWFERKHRAGCPANRPARCLPYVGQASSLPVERASCPLLAACGLLALACLTGTARAGDWPQWLGPQRNGHAEADSPAVEKLAPEL